MASERDKLPVGPMGFAGLASLASDVDAVVSAATRSASKHTSQARPPDSSPATVHRSASRLDDRCVRDQEPAAAPIQRGSRGRWVFGAVAAAVAIWLIAFIASTSEPPGFRASSPSRGTSSATASTTTSSPSPNRPSYLSQPDEPRPDRSEQMPPVGSGHVLNAAQIRYCLSEDIRLEAARDVISADTEVDRFNAMVEDFNSRCVNYRYRQRVFQSVQRQVEADRSLLELEGIARFGR